MGSVIGSMFSAVGNFINLAKNKDMPSGGEVELAFKHTIGAIRFASSSTIGAGRLRTICAPDENLKARQRAILRRLENIPCHPSAHGFIAGRDPLTCASAHTSYWGNKPNNLVILNMDAKDFFPSITSQLVRKALESNHVRPTDVDEVVSTCMVRADESLALAVIEGLARVSRRHGAESPLLAALTKGGGIVLPEGVTKKIAYAICQNFLSLGPGVTMVNKFLPQGAPTSPFLSNMAMKLVDIRLSAMASSFGGFYTRYADDLTVSWPVPTKGKVIDGMYRCSTLVLIESGIQMNRKKKRVMGPGVRQDIVGLCVNSGHPTITRKKRLKIRAAVHNEMVRGSARFRRGERPRQQWEDYARPVPKGRRLSFLMGSIGYVGSAHPRESARLMNSIKTLTDDSMITPLQFIHPDKVFEINEVHESWGHRGEDIQFVEVTP